ncbi:Uncharacterised protein [Halioglobus japonicus]|nr:Uncharacterised protein [Halioglobus japonicus]
MAGQLILNSDVTDELNENELPFSAIITEERVLCINDGGCLQQAKFESESISGSLRHRSEPWLEQGQAVNVIKVWDHKTMKETNRRPGVFHYEVHGNDS